MRHGTGLGWVAAALLLTGCAATASQSWRTAADPAAPIWKITGTQSAFGRTAIAINDEPVLEGKISLFTGEAQLTGTYDGRPVHADCTRARVSKARTRCAITVDGRKATTLYFRVD